MQERFVRYGVAVTAITVSVGAGGAMPARAQTASSCLVPQRDAAVARAALPEYPSLAREQRGSGSARVKINLRANGEIAGTSIAESSGNYLLDLAAINTTRASRFTPELRDCEPVDGSYIYVVTFEP